MDPKETETVLQLEWAAISAAPFSFIGALAVIGGVIFLFIRGFYKQQIVTLTERRKLAHEQAEDTQNKKKGLEAEIESLQAEIRRLKEAIEQDAAKRDQPVSPSVLQANTATENAMERVKEKEGEFNGAYEAMMAAMLDAWKNKHVTG